ncbi:CMRF35-like molecule 7 [Porphyrio hochstetteri]
MRILLVWTFLPGSWAVTGPAQVMAEQGGSLVVSCSYKPGYKLYPKYWCRQSFFWFCFTYMAQTNGSEVTVTQGRVSITDDHTTYSFTVMLGNVMPEDEGWYSCGMRRSLWFNLWHTTKVMVSADASTTTEGRNMSPTATNPLCPTGWKNPPVLSQLNITHLLLCLSVKVPLVLALVCQAAWMRSQRRSHDQENLQLLEVAGSTGAPGLPHTPEAQEHPPAPLPPTLLGLCHT